MNASVGHFVIGEPYQDLQYYQESLATLREMGAAAAMCNAISNMSGIAQHLGDYALQQSEKALALARELGLLAIVARSLSYIADCSSLTGKPEEAADRLAECRRVLYSVEHRKLEARALFTEALIAYLREDYGAALDPGAVLATYVQDEQS